MVLPLICNQSSLSFSENFLIFPSFGKMSFLGTGLSEENFREPFTSMAGSRITFLYLREKYRNNNNKVKMGTNKINKKEREIER